MTLDEAAAELGDDDLEVLAAYVLSEWERGGFGFARPHTGPEGWHTHVKSCT